MSTYTPAISQPFVQIRQKQWANNRPLLSVVIPCFNYGSFLVSALDSVQAQTFSDIEIIVVDGGSTDGTTPEIVRNIKLPKTRVFLRKKPHLVGDNRNFGIKKARGKYICCLDPDDTLSPTFLEKALILSECADYDIVSTSYRVFGNRNEEVILPSYPSFSQVINGAAMPSVSVFKKIFWEKIGGYYDTGIGAKHIPEDWDFYIRAVGQGARLYNFREPLLNVRFHDHSLHRNVENPGYYAQLQSLRWKHRKSLTFNNFEKFNMRNETLIHVDSATRNLIVYDSADNTPGLLLIPPIFNNQMELDLHLKFLDNMGERGNLVVLCLTHVSELPEQLYDSYSDLTANIFSLADMPDNFYLKMTLLDYLIQSRHIKKLFVGSSGFSCADNFGLSRLYDLVKNHAG
jgi:O-antigen biosynthesis protein